MSFPTYRSVEEAQAAHDASHARIWAAINEYRERCANGDTSNPPFVQPMTDNTVGEDPGWFTPEEEQP